MSGIKDYSTTPANNDAAPPNGFPEGMAPASVNDGMRQVMADIRSWYEDPAWINYGDALTYSSGTVFIVTNDLTARYAVGRRIRATGTTPFSVEGTIVSSTYSSPNTTVTVVWDSGSMDSTLNNVFVNFVGASNNNFSGSSSFTGKLLTPDAGELTIASGAITVTGAYHTVDTEGDAATDDLVTINGGADGQVLTLRIENDARAVVIKTSGNIITSQGNDVFLLNTNTRVSFIYDGQKSKWICQYFYPFQDRIINGLSVSIATDADHDRTFAAGSAADQTLSIRMVLSSALTKQADATFAAGNNAGGFVSGESLPTSGTIHYWLIATATGSTDICINNHASSGLNPTLPSGYVYKRRLCSMTTDASANVNLVEQYGNNFKYRNQIADYAPGTALRDPAADLNVSVPDGVTVMGDFEFKLSSAGSGVVSRLMSVRTDPASSVVVNVGEVNQSFGVSFNSLYIRCTDRQLKQLRVFQSSGGLDTSPQVSTRGWIDERVL